MKVHEIFRSIQGEGKLAGIPMTFIRLYGCNMVPLCSWCDTPQDPGNYTERSIEEIVNQVEDDWVCITGGEPTIHKNLRKLVSRLQEKGYYVALETNGLNIAPYANWICVSPKSDWPLRFNLSISNEIKLLVGSGMYDVEEVLTQVHEGEWHSGWHNKTSLLPIWDDNYKDNLARAIELCQKYQVRLTVQLHKYLGVR